LPHPTLNDRAARSITQIAAAPLSTAIAQPDNDVMLQDIYLSMHVIRWDISGQIETFDSVKTVCRKGNQSSKHDRDAEREA
jgi:hypothetical protein